MTTLEYALYSTYYIYSTRAHLYNFGGSGGVKVIQSPQELLLNFIDLSVGRREVKLMSSLSDCLTLRISRHRLNCGA